MENGVLIVKVFEGRDLIACDKGGTSDPYCVVTFGSVQKKTKTIKKTVSPRWESGDPDTWTFEFPVDQTSPPEILFELFDWNRIAAPKRMGKCKVTLKEALEVSELNKWFKLVPQKDRDEVTGDVRVSVQFRKAATLNHSDNNNNNNNANSGFSSRKSFMHSSNTTNPVSEEHELFTAIKNSDLRKVEQLIADPALDINMKDPYGYTPLHSACCIFSDVDDQILALILTHKNINVNIENEDKNTPLHYFCQKFRSPNCTDAFEIFIEKGANVSAQNNNGETPLHKAIFNNSVKVLMTSLLIKAGADVNRVNLLGETPLHYAVRLGREDLVAILLKGGADVNIKNTKEKKTPYDLAVEIKHEKMAYLLNRAKGLFDWLEEVGMDKYKTVFIKEEMYRDLLPDLDEKALDRMAITTTGHRLKLLKAAKLLKDQQQKEKEQQQHHVTIATSSSSISPPQPSTGTSSGTDNNGATAESSSSSSSSSSSPSSSSPSSTGSNPATTFTGAGNAGLIVGKSDMKAGDIEQELEQLKYINKSGTWILHNSELEFTVKLGSGASGTVYKGLYKGKEVAIKVLKTEQSQKELEEFKKEFQIMSTVQSPYVVFFFGACLEPKMCMVMELCSRGSLYHAMSDPDISFGWDKVVFIAKEMVKGIDELHSHVPQIFHRDFKSLNLMVNEQWHVKVADFGLSRFNTETQKETLGKMRGTFAYCAPEVYFGEKFTAKSDVYSISIVLWELVTRCIKREYFRPYQEYPNLHFDFQIIIQTAKKGLRPTIPPTTPAGFVDLIKQAWDHDANKRPDCKQMLVALDALEQDYLQNTEKWDQLRDPPKAPAAEQPTAPAAENK